jgi:hypothetical protein
MCVSWALKFFITAEKWFTGGEANVAASPEMTRTVCHILE